MFRPVIIIVFWLVVKVSFATTQLDSIAVEREFSAILDLCYDNPDSAKIRIDRIIRREKNKNSYFEGKAYNIKGIYCDITNNWDSALFYYRKAIQVAGNIGNESLKAGALNNIGLIYWNRNENNAAVEYFFQSLRLYEKLGNYLGTAGNYSNIALIFDSQKEHEKAIEFQRKALQYYQKVNSLRNIAIAYTNLALFYDNLHQPDSSHHYLKQSISIKKQLNDNYGLGISYNDLGAYFLSKKMLDSAIYYFQASIRLLKPFSHKKLITSNYASIGKAYLDLKDYPNAEKYLKLAEEQAEKHQLKYQLLMAYDRLAKLYSEQHKFEQAAEYYKNAYTLNSRLFDVEKDKQISELEKKYQTEKQKKELLEKNEVILRQEYQSKIKNLWLIILALSIVAAVVIFIIQYKKHSLKKEQEKEAELQKQRLEISRELHDNIGANLTYISSTLDYFSFTQKNDSMKELSSYTKKTIKELRETVKTIGIKQFSIQEFKDKVEELVGNFSKQQQAVDFRLQVDYKGKSLKPLVGLNLFRIIQEAVNNAIKYAGAKQIFIRFSGDANGFLLQISDDGNGFDTNEVTDGNGLNNMKKRAELINALLTIVSTPGQGTRITVEG